MNAWYFVRKNWPTLSLNGSEAEAWLHTISSQDIKAMTVSSLSFTSFLTGGGKLIAKAVIYKKGPAEFLLFFEPWSKEQVEKHFSFMHFGEDVKWEWEQKLVLVDSGEKLPGGFESFPAEEWNLQGCLTLLPSDQVDGLELPGFRLVDFESYCKMRAENIFPLDHKEILSSDILLEASLKSYISETKGCYPGQEVIAKIITYGKVARHICKISWNHAIEGKEIYNSSQKKVGELRSIYTTEDGVKFGLAYIQRMAVENFQSDQSALYIEKSEPVLSLEIKKS